jgi:hypothetical protein
VLDSKCPELVLQEIWGHLCCHYAICCLMAMPPSAAATTRTGWASSPRATITRQSVAQLGPFFADGNDPGGRLWLALLRRLIAGLNPT